MATSLDPSEKGVKSVIYD